MVRIKGTPPDYWQKQLGKALVFSRWRGIPYVRSKGYPKPRTRSASELATVARFASDAYAYKDRDTTTNSALDAMSAGSQKRSMDVWMGLAVGQVITISGWNYQPDEAGLNMIQINLCPIVNEGSTTFNINSAAGRAIGALAIWVPFSKATYNRIRVIGFGNSTQAGQTITLRPIYGFNYATPMWDASADIVKNNTFAQFDSGDIPLINVPATDQLVGFGAKGSNATVDFLCNVLLVALWQEP